ncbi:HK97-gp10 family putative phage morphogenesis protein [Sphingomonas phyllosphaerae]|uniref:HK97-gp10 family putative phage morphogenesis protein n=1 Tax=Sphingomonas phyllosphaerae TaxID=257003 RepID=UPI0003B3B81E|nr:HK97-gp10 family putative phage morphogenesis protein [Sphingomonas phyllosphaerae]
MPKITGGKSHAARLKRLTSPAAMESVGRALYAAGERIQVAAQISITEGAVSGKAHLPSAPGSPPNNDTGVLANNIETARDPDNPLRVTVSSNAPYASSQEFGNSKLPERPYMRPAVARERKAVTQLVGQAVSAAIKGER